jgi:hypothetical protein
LGFGVGVLGLGRWPTPQPPIPNPQSPIVKIFKICIYKYVYWNSNLLFNIINK